MATPKKKTNPSAKAEPASKKPAKSSEKGGNGSGVRASPVASKQQPPPPPPPPRVSPVDPELLDEIRAALLRKKHELGSNVNNELDDMREAAEGHHLADMDDLGGDAHDEETQFKIMEIESVELDQIDQALDRISAGTFGVCEACEKPIPPDRLRALPFANLCIACKRLQEQNES